MSEKSSTQRFDVAFLSMDRKVADQVATQEVQSKIN